jgi:tape measure domain-containing protein|nr:MAG TPA: tail tape measure [Caudoviricetes sp.]
MGKSIENKVVSLELDDSKFTSRVDGVLHNVDRLKSGMNFKQSTDGLDNVGKAAQDASKQMGGIADGVKNINTSVVNNSTTAAAATANVGAAAKISSTNFSMLAGAASVAMGNIASKALMAGGSVLSSFTFGPIMDGFREYENQLNAVQTIQANTFSKGETTATINAALDELNAYADRTIYSFTEMTRNIGMFTSAGVGLKDSVAAIKGLSNVAAMSGSTSEQAATAMYQLSQALSTGSVKLQDWNSIVNAGMGGEQFQEALKRTARTYGVEVDKMIDKAGSFRNSLKDGWLTSEIMIETLTQYTGDLSREQLLSAGYTEQQADEIMKLAETANDAATKVKTFSQLIDTTAEALGSGWASIFRTIFGDFERARTMWTAVSDVVNGGIGTFFDALQGILDRWDELGGWEEWWYGLGELWTAIAKPLKAIGEGFFSAFQGDAGKALYDFSYYFRHSISQWLMMSDDFANNLGKVFKMAGELLSPVLEVLIGFASAIVQIGVAAFKIGMILAGIFIKPMILIAAKVGDIVSVFSDWFGQMLGGTDILGGLSKVLDWIVDKFQKLADWMYAIADVTITPIFDGLKVVIEAVLKPLGEFIETIKKATSNVFKPFGDAISNVVGAIFGFASGTGGPMEKIKSAFGGFGSGFLENMTKLADAIGPKWSEKVKAFSDSIIPISETIGKHLGGAVESAGKGIKKFWDDASPKLAEAWSESTKRMKDSISGVGEAFGRAGDTMAKTFAPQVKAVKEFGVDLYNVFANLDTHLNNNTFLSTIVNSFKTMMKSFGPFGDLINGIIDLFGKLGDLTKSIFGGFGDEANGAASGLSTFGKAASDAFNTLGVVGGTIYAAATGIVEFCASVVEAIANLIAWLTKGIDSIKKFASESQAFDSFKKNVSKAFDNAGSMIQTFWSGLGSSLKDLSISDLLSGILLGGGLGMGFKTLQTMLGQFTKVTDSFSGMFDKFGKIGDSIAGVFNSMTSALKSMQEVIKAKALREIAISVGILAGSLFLLAMIPAPRLIQGAVAIGVLAKILLIALTQISEMKINKMQIAGVIGAVMALSVAILLMSISVGILGSMKLSTVAQGIGAVMVLVLGMTTAAKLLSKDSKTMIQGVGTMILMAAAINMLTIPIIALGLLPIKVIAQGVIAIGVLMGILAGFVLLMNKAASDLGKMAAISLMMVSFAFSIQMLVAAVAVMGYMDIAKLVQGITGLSAVVLLLVAIANLMPATAIVGAGSLILTAIAMNIAVGAIVQMADHSWGEILSSMGKLLLVVAAIVAVASAAQGAIIGIASLTILAFALNLFTSALSNVAGLSWDALSNGLLAIGVGLGILIAAGYLAVGASVGLIALSVAIGVLGLVVMGIIGGIIILVAILTTFISVVALAGPTIGAGIVAIAAGIASAAAIIAAAAPAIQAALIGVFTAFENAAPAFGNAVTSLIKSLIPAVNELIILAGVAIRQFISQIYQIIKQKMPELVQIVVLTISGILEALRNVWPEFLKTILDMLGQFFLAIGENIPKFSAAFQLILTGFVDLIKANVPLIIGAFLALIQAMLDGLATKIPDLMKSGANLIAAMINGIAAQSVIIINAAWDAVITFINGFADAIDQKGPELQAAVNKLIKAIINFIKNGLTGMANTFAPHASSIGRNIINGVVNGVSGAAGALYNKLRNVASSALSSFKSTLGIHSPSRVFATAAGFIVAGIVQGIDSNQSDAVDAMSGLGSEMVNAMSNLDTDWNPVIKPTVDLSEVNGLQDLTMNDLHANVVGTSVQNGSQTAQEIRALRDELRNNQKPMVFNQYNESPKALDLNDLYRQTERQLERMKRI